MFVMGKTIGVLSLKGGVGKTSSVIALGDALADFGKKVLLVDANLSSPNLGLHLNILNPEKTLHDVLDRLDNIKDAIYTSGKFDVIPASLMDRKVNPLELKNRLRSLKDDYDYVLIDSSPALNDETLGAMMASDEMLVVTTPDVPTLGVTMKAVKFAKKQGTPISGLILNKVHGKNFEIPLEDVEEMTNTPVLAVIPNDINILKSVSRFQSLTEFKPFSKASTEFRKLAAVLSGGKYKPGGIRELINRFWPDRQTVNREVYYKRVFDEEEN